MKLVEFTEPTKGTKITKVTDAHILANACGLLADAIIAQDQDVIRILLTALTFTEASLEGDKLTIGSLNVQPRNKLAQALFERKVRRNTAVINTEGGLIRQLTVNQPVVYFTDEEYESEVEARETANKKKADKAAK